MSQEIGESREKLGRDVWAQAEDIASKMKAEDRPFYIVYACKQDKNNPAILRQAFKMYKAKPPLMLGILVWYVDSLGDMQFKHELSAPMDIPVDPTLLSDKASDVSGRIADKGKQLNVLVS